MKRLMAILISILIVGITGLGLLKGPGAGTRDFLYSESGFMEVPLEELSHPIELSGEWTFYPGIDVDPENLQDIRQAPESVNLGDCLLNKTRMSEKMKPGTYRMVIRLPEDDRVAFKINSIHRSNHLFINGEKVRAARKESYGGFSVQERSRLVFAETVGRELDILLQVKRPSQLDRGGSGPILFGTPDQIIRKDSREKLFDGMVVGGFILLAMVGLFHFLQSRSEKFELYFALFSLTIAIYSSTLHEKLIYLALPNLNHFTLSSLQISFLSFSVLFFISFIEKLFIDRPVWWWKRGIVLLLLFYGIQALFSNFTESISTKINPILYQTLLIGILGSAFLYILTTMAIAFRGRRAGSEYLLPTTVAFACFGLLIGAELIGGLDIGRLPLFLFFVMTATFALFMAERRQLAYQETAELTAKLLVQGGERNNFLVRMAAAFEAPLSGMMEEAAELMSGAVGPLNQEQQERMIGVNRNARRLRQIVESLDFAGGGRSVPGPMPVRIEMTDIKQMAEEIVMLLDRPEYSPFSYDLSVDLPPVLADEGLLRQILYHMMNYALRNSGNDGLEISAGQYGGKVKLTVQIKHSGKDWEDATRLFDPFYQLTGNPEGLALGLPIAKRLAGLIGSEIGAESKQGAGLDLFLVLPLAEEHQGPEREQGRKTAGWYGDSAAKGVVLFAGHDGNESDRFVKYLAKEYYVLKVDSGSAAIRAIKQQRFDIAVIGFRLPDRPGTAVARSIRKRHHAIELPVLLLTEEDEAGNVVGLGEADVTDLLYGGATESELMSRVKALMAMQEAVAESVRQGLAGYHAQIAPHFLFNTLNTVIALSYEDPNKMRGALEHLAVYFRAKLDYQKQQGLVHLSDEIELVRSYIAIEQLRYGHRLTVCEDIDECIDVEIPAMTIQPLVENAIHHGLADKKEGAVLTWTIRKANGGVEIAIRDNGKGIHEERQRQMLRGDTGRLGFQNPMQKVKLIPGSSFILDSVEGHGTSVIIHLPTRRETGG
ncbi:histidine kinase [Bhargavaea cecembensis]|uniref:histidine kinase n=1 Tax=Bhargavaea cecembensis TaxID=394098 RepID=UPI000590DDAC|nr:histidine kinase [Bhargavaea cecembensis]